MRPAPDLVGRILAGRYRVLRPIGQGGMGAVYEAEQLELRRTVALKVLFDTDVKSVERFRAEALAAAALDHPNVVRVFELCTEGDAPFLVMERVTGESLATFIRREGPLAPARAVRIACELLDALAAAHDAGIVHRDVKPSNVLLAGAGATVKVVDFGIAKRLDGAGVKTTTGTILGTTGYLAPEQVLGEAADSRADLWAVGVCLFEMLSGARPFRAHAPEIYEEILLRDAPPLPASVPPALGRVVAKALAKHKEERFASAMEMRAELVASSEADDATAASSAPKRLEAAPERPASRRTATVFGLALAATLVVALAVGLGFRARLAPRDAKKVALEVAPSSEIDAAGDPASPVDASALSADEDVSDGPPRSVAPARAGGTKSCVCSSATEYLCKHLAPRCDCIDPTGVPSCPQRWVLGSRGEGICPVTQEWGRDGAETGGPCTTFRFDRQEVEDHVYFKIRGTLRCSQCTRSDAYAQRQIAVPGTRCGGFASNGGWSWGSWKETHDR